ncbi:ROK family transcriptional regulator [Cryobacterium sp. Y62]|uniref:ROK family transcriptional regulator n=1 Tax=Cryobacterium sp. Y62 TaxID=2048284 RepID=UPI001E28C5F9|nr:ROK family transcriptional regulator [Cryobacterium sp. Y62]
MQHDSAAQVRRGTNLPRMGNFNRAVMLDYIRRSEGGLSRVALGRLTGLSAQTVSNICRKLLDQGVVREAEKEITGPGKPRTILRLNPGAVLAVGVHLDPAVITFVIIDLAGGVVAHSRRYTPDATDPARIIAEMSQEIEWLIRDSGVDRTRISGLGVASPGPIDPVHGTVIDPPNLSGWHRVPLRSALAEVTGLHTIVDKDVTAAAVAEHWFGGASGAGSFVFFYLGTGLGAGLVLDGEIVRGRSHNAGEIGHIVTDPDGALCDCGLRGCLAVTCTPASLVAEAEALGLKLTGPAASDVPTSSVNAAHDIDVKFSALCQLSDSGDPAAEEVLERSVIRVVNAVSMITNLLDVDRVVFGGPYWSRLRERYLRRIPSLLDGLTAARSIHRVGVVGTGVGEDVGAIGAACLVLDHTLAPRAASLLLAE